MIPSRFAAVLGVLLLFAGPAFALSSPSEMLANPVLEKRAEALGMQLRCVVCQNESIEQSNASLAQQFRGIIRRRVEEGWSDKRIIAWMVQRYGTFILLRPPFNPMTWLLWGAPALALLVGGAAVVLARRRHPTSPEPLSPAEQQRLADLLK
jgi:cytochrome c-type biogenesis protein CcmH